MEVYKSPYITISIDQSRSVIKFIWSENASYEKMPDDIFRIEVLKQTELIEKYEVKYVLIETLNFTFTISLTTQTWIDEEIYPKWAKSGVKKIALTTSQEFIAQLSIEQAIDENSSKEMVSQFFENESKALEWLM